MVYLPPLFNETRTEVLLEHIERHDFGLLITHGPAGLTVSQIPFLVERRDDRLYLTGHIARPNPQAADLEDGEALVVFHGPHAYVSPSWYATQPAVPTWNYASVHAYGRPRTILDREWLAHMLRRLTERHESREPERGWNMEALPEAFLETMLNGIIGVEIAVERLEGKFKLSQNRPAADRPRVIAALQRRGDADSRAVADLMRMREPEGT